jgi:hypothetical protein
VHIPSADNITIEEGHYSSLCSTASIIAAVGIQNALLVSISRTYALPDSDYSGSVDEEGEEDEPVFEDCVETFRELKEEPVSCWPFCIFN